MKRIIRLSESDLHRIIKCVISEQTQYSNNIEFNTSGEYEIEFEDLENKLNIINKYFPFKTVNGYYDSNEGLDLSFDNGIKISGIFKEEPLIVSMMINGNEYEINIHPFGGLGGFSNNIFEEDIKSVYDEENTVSLVIGHEGYAIKSISIDKSKLDELKIYLVRGTQIEGDILGDTLNGKRDYEEKYKTIHQNEN